MIEGFHERFVARRSVPKDRRMTDLHILRWQVAVSETTLSYKLATFDLATNSYGKLEEHWETPIYSIKSVQLEPAYKYDTLLWRQSDIVCATSSFLSFYDLQMHPDPKFIKDFNEPIYQSPSEYSNSENLLLVLYFFLSDGSRKRIAVRRDSKSKYEGRGLDAILKYQVALTDAVHGARRRKQVAKMERIEKARYL